MPGPNSAVAIDSRRQGQRIDRAFDPSPLALFMGHWPGLSRSTRLDRYPLAVSY